MIIPKPPKGAAHLHGHAVRSWGRRHVPPSAWAARVRGLGHWLGPLVPRVRFAHPRLISVARFAGLHTEGG